MSATVVAKCERAPYKISVRYLSLNCLESENHTTERNIHLDTDLFYFHDSNRLGGATYYSQQGEGFNDDDRANFATHSIGGHGSFECVSDLRLA